MIKYKYERIIVNFEWIMIESPTRRQLEEPTCQDYFSILRGADILALVMSRPHYLPRNYGNSLVTL